MVSAAPDDLHARTRNQIQPYSGVGRGNIHAGALAVAVSPAAFRVALELNALVSALFIPSRDYWHLC